MATLVATGRPCVLKLGAVDRETFGVVQEAVEERYHGGFSGPVIDGEPGGLLSSYLLLSIHCVEC